MSPDRDLTIESALTDPVIRAAMDADRVNPREFEALLRATARRLDTTRVHQQPFVPAARSSWACAREWMTCTA